MRWSLPSWTSAGTGCSIASTPSSPLQPGDTVQLALRLSQHTLDKPLLERTVALAEQTGGFGARQWRAVLDATPLFGAGRVEETFNLLGQALRKGVERAAAQLDTSVEAIVADAGLLLVGPSRLNAALEPIGEYPPRGSTPWGLSWRRWNDGRAGWSSSSNARRMSRRGQR